MKNKKWLTNATLASIGIIFVVSLVLIIYFNNKTQTENFWNNQKDKLALITEKCAMEINDWAYLQTAILKAVSGETQSGIFQSAEEYEEYLARVVERNPEIQAAYITLDNGMNYLNDDFNLSSGDEDFFEWYRICKDARGEIIFTEPYLDTFTKELVVSCLQAITMPDGVQGVAGIDISLKSLVEKVDALSPSQTGGTWLVSSGFKVVTYGVDQSFLPQIMDENPHLDLTETLSDPEKTPKYIAQGDVAFLNAGWVLNQIEIVEDIDKYDADKGIHMEYIKDYDGSIKYEATTAISSMGWILGVNIPLSDYAADVQALTNGQYPIILLALLMSITSIIIALRLVLSARRHQQLEKEHNETLSRVNELNVFQLTKLNLVIKAAKISLWDMEVINDDPLNPDNIANWSDEFRYMLGYSDETDFPNVFRSWSGLLHPDDIARTLDLAERHLFDKTGNTPYDIEFRLLKKNGEYGYFHAYGETIRDENGCAIRVAGALKDITDERQRAEEMTEAIRQRAEAQAASKTKSEFLSKMSHEMRTPMNAIIGMTKIANTANDMSKINYCLSTIEASSTHLLGIINDVLDMAKIEAGKLELDSAPMNVEKMLMMICNLVVDKTEQKSQNFDIILGKNMGMHYIGDELRLSQVITNILSNAVKFTPEKGTIKLTVDEVSRKGNNSILRFSISDTGIGMTKEQIDKLFRSFEQADGSIARRFGGTGLGLVISKNIVEKMDGQIWVESELGKGSAFIFEIMLERSAQQDTTVIFDGINPSDLKVLIVDDEYEPREHFKSIIDGFGINNEEADSGKKAIYMANMAKETHKPYDIIFLDYDMPDMDAIEVIRKLHAEIDKNTVIIMTSFLTWNKIENEAKNVGVSRFISKPFFPSAILDAINETIGRKVKNLGIKTETSRETPDFSGVNLLLAEDIDINREIFMALLEDTNIHIDIAENGVIAVQKFKDDPDKYDLIIMDVQMPEMDGCEATQKIRALAMPKAKSIPIIAMTANVFKEDIERCVASGMNDHLSKPIDEKEVVKKIEFYLNTIDRMSQRNTSA